MSKAKVLIAGDFSPRFKEADFYTAENINKIANPIKEIISQYDLAVVNCETVYTDNETPIVKSGPNIKAIAPSANLLKAMNFNLIACANNHFGDYGEQGVKDTLKKIRSMNLDTVGAGNNSQEAEKTYYTEKNGISIAVINCAEHEFGIATDNTAGVAGVDYYGTGHKIKASKADVTIVYLHGGIEECPIPRPGLKKLCRYFVECGAAAVIVCHSHCPVGKEWYMGAPIVYGTGNFYFTSNASDWAWEHGYMVGLDINKNGVDDMCLIPYIQHSDGTQIEILSGSQKEKFLHYIEGISHLINNEEKCRKLYLAWVKYYVELVKGWGMLEFNDDPMSGPSLFIQNTYTCESHTEVFRIYCLAKYRGELENLSEYQALIEKLQKGILEGE